MSREDSLATAEGNQTSQPLWETARSLTVKVKPGNWTAKRCHFQESVQDKGNLMPLPKLTHGRW